MSRWVIYPKGQPHNVVGTGATHDDAAAEAEDLARRDNFPYVVREMPEKTIVWPGGERTHYLGDVQMGVAHPHGNEV